MSTKTNIFYYYPACALQVVHCSSFEEFARRAAIGLALLDFLDEVETVFHEPVHLCDVKPEHFGISDRGRVKFVDLDAVGFKTIIGENKSLLNLCKVTRY